MNLSRRMFLWSGAVAASLAGRGALAQAPAAIVPGEGRAAMPLRDALARRESIRLYTEDPIADDVLIDLLWAANGVNRADVDGRTAPSWRTAKDTEIYVAQASGVSRFDAQTNTLVPVLGEDIRKITSTQPFVGSAPVVLIYVSELTRILAAAGIAEHTPESVTEDHRVAAHVNTAVIAQNVYLFAAAEELGTCLIGGADRAAITAALGLEAEQLVTYVQPVGHPKP